MERNVCADIVDEGWITEPFGVIVEGDKEPFKVATSSGMSACPVLDSSNQLVATLYGHLLTGWMGPGLSFSGNSIHFNGHIRDFSAFENEILDGIHGSFVMLTSNLLGARLYPDCGASIPIVYSSDTRRAGSSADQILSDEEYCERLLEERVRDLIGKEGRHGWISGTLTAHSGIERLLPNHYLDLMTFATHRFWPRLSEFNLTRSVDDAVERVANDLRRFVEAAANQYDTAITMTAGFDSRILLASARDAADQVTFLTFGGPREGIDQVLAVEIVSELGLHHRLLPVVPATPAQAARWDRVVGHAVREVNRETHPTLGTITEDIIITGMYGETGRARLYRQDMATINEQAATASFVLSRLTLPLDETLVANVEAWLEPIRALPRSAVLDLAFNELRFGSWAMGQAPAQKALKLSLMPYAQRSIQDAFMSVMPGEQTTERLFRRLGGQLWPEAMTAPINRYGDYRDWLQVAKKSVDRERMRRVIRARRAR